MGLLTRYLTASTPVRSSAGVEVHAHESTLVPATWPDATTSGFLGAGAGVTRDVAIQVPAVARARNVIAGTVGQLPLAVWADETQKVTQPRAWVRQPERDLPAVHTITWTVDDLLFHGIGYWRVTAVYAEDGRPLRYERIAPWRVSPRLDRTGRRIVGHDVDGSLAPRVGVGRLVAFHGLDEGLLRRAPRTIRTALALEQAAANYANEPVPAAVLKNSSGAVLSDTRVEALLAKWKTARQTKATAYVDALELEAVGIDPEGMQLAEARQHIAIEIARHCNLDANYVNAAESGSSVTYSNSVQKRRELIDFTLRHYMAVLEQRLTLDDVTTLGQSVRFDLDDFLRGDAKERAEVAEINTRSGVWTVDEARAREGLPPTNGQE